MRIVVTAHSGRGARARRPTSRGAAPPSARRRVPSVIPRSACRVVGWISARYRCPTSRTSETYISPSWSITVAREAEARVALAEPEQRPRDGEEEREGRGQRGVQLLPRVEAPLRTPACRAARGGRRGRRGRARARCGAAPGGRRGRRAPRSARPRRSPCRGAPPSPSAGARPPPRAPGRRARAPSRAGRRRRSRAPSASARSVRPKRRTSLRRSSHSSARPRRRRRSRSAPSSRLIGAGAATISRDPLRVLVAVHLRDHDPHRRAVRARERLPVHLVGEHHLREPRLLERERVGVRLLGGDERERVRRRLEPRRRRAGRRSGRPPSGRSGRSSR